MRIHCDVCGAEIPKENAVTFEVEDEVLYFCSEECLASRAYHETMQDPDRGDEGSAPDIR